MSNVHQQKSINYRQFWGTFGKNMGNMGGFSENMGGNMGNMGNMGNTGNMLKVGSLRIPNQQ